MQYLQFYFLLFFAILVLYNAVKRNCMLKKERHNFIVRQINLHNKILSSDLSGQLKVSEDTVRRDLNELAIEGKLLKVHGGALSRSYHFPFTGVDVYALDAKKAVAFKAAKLIKDGMNILTAGGTTVIEMVKNIPVNIKATIFTISPLVALELADHQNIEVLLIGGQISKNAHITIGSQVTNFMSEIKADICILGTNGISVESGVTDSDLEVVQVKKAMINVSNKLAVLTISEKLNSEQRMKVCSNNQIHTLITELDPQSKELKAYYDLGITIL